MNLVGEDFMIFIIWFNFIIMFGKIVRKFLFRLISKGIIIYREVCFFYWIYFLGINIILFINLLVCLIKYVIY